MAKAPSPKRLQAVFYQTEAGTQPVLDWLRALEAKDRLIIGQDIRTVELGWPIGMPVCRPLERGLYEVRSSIQAGKVEARVYFTITAGLMVLLHYQQGHKARQAADIATARKNLRAYHRRK